MFKRKLNKKILNSILMTSLLVILLISTLTASAIYRPAAVGIDGMVTSANPLASIAGVQTLMKGGNAIDAAVATAAALGVVETSLSSMGGNGFAVIYLADEDKVLSLGLTGAAPYATDINELVADDLGDGYKAGNVPGNMGGWLDALKKYGTMSIAEVFAVGTDYAENGIPVSPFFNRFASAALKDYPTSAAIYYPDGEKHEVGEIIVAKDMANTYKKMVEAERNALAQGKSREEAIQAAIDRFYKGDIAKEMARFYQENGGLFTYQDFADFEPIWKEPLHGTYRGYDIYMNPSTSRGGYELIMQLNLIEGFDVAALGHNSAEYLHLLIECIKVAKSDVYEYVADEEFTDIPVEGMLSKEYADLRRKLIDVDKVSPYPNAGNPGDYQTKGYSPVYTTASLYMTPESPDQEEQTGERETSNLNIVDKWGNAVTSTITHGGGFGTKVAVGNTGLFFNNGTRIGNTVSPYQENVNSLEGGKIPILNNSPVMVFKDGKLFYLFGSPGGESIGGNQFQTLLNVLDFGMSVQEAIEAPRGRLYAKPNFYTPGAEISSQWETGVGEEVIAGLLEKGQIASLYDDQFTASTGGIQAILVHPVYGTLTGAGDPRREGYAIGY